MVSLKRVPIKNFMTLELFDLLGCYAELIGSYLPTFRVSPLVPPAKVMSFTDVSGHPLCHIAKGKTILGLLDA